MRIQPHDIPVPEEDPFRHDLLDRKKSVEVLTHLVRSFEGPCVLVVDAAWGNGKTTFLKIWRQYLINVGFSVVQFNAWETDFAGDPFLALCTELTDELETHIGLAGLARGSQWRWIGHDQHFGRPLFEGTPHIKKRLKSVPCTYGRNHPFQRHFLVAAL